MRIIIVIYIIFFLAIPNVFSDDLLDELNSSVEKYDSSEVESGAKKFVKKTWNETKEGLRQAAEIEINASGECLALRANCLANCQGYDSKDGNLLLDSSKEKCEAYCYEAFYHCNK